MYNTSLWDPFSYQNPSIATSFYPTSLATNNLPIWRPAIDVRETGNALA